MFAEMEFGVQVGYNNCERKGLKAELGKRRNLMQACLRDALEQGSLVRIPCWIEMLSLYTCSGVGCPGKAVPEGLAAGGCLMTRFPAAAGSKSFLEGEI